VIDGLMLEAVAVMRRCSGGMNMEGVGMDRVVIFIDLCVAVSLSVCLLLGLF
jgi:hypothetical protein